MSQSLSTHAGQFLTFQLDGELFGIPIFVVREINRVTDVTSVPKAPPFVKGVMNLRGKIIPVIDLRLKFGLKPADYTRDTCIIVIETPHGQMGNIVDAVKEVVEFDASEIDSAPHFGAAGYQGFVKGLGKKDDKVIIIVDIVESFENSDWNQVKDLKEVA
jgi:purine-binding chemotaxis protein CheW